jgi:hypothetical protein
MPAPTGPVRADAVAAQAGVVKGRLEWSDSNRPWPVVTVTLRRDDWAGTARAAADTFRIEGVTPGKYEMRTSLLGQRPRVDTLHVPATGLAVVVPFAWVQMLDGCGNNVTTVRAGP